MYNIIYNYIIRLSMILGAINKHETELHKWMEWNWDHFHRFIYCPLSYILLLKEDLRSL